MQTELRRSWSTTGVEPGAVAAASVAGALQERLRLTRGRREIPVMVIAVFRFTLNEW